MKLFGNILVFESLKLYKLKTTYLLMVSMGQVNLKVDDKLEREFRRVAVERFEARKGFLKKAVEEAMRDWITKNSEGAENVRKSSST